MSATDLVLASAGATGGDVNYIDDCFATHLYTGNGSSQTITNGIDLAGKGGLVWLKRRTSVGGTAGHRLFDSASGGGDFLFLQSNATAAQSSYSPNNLSSFNSNGFTLQSDSSQNGSGDTYVSWTFRKAPKFFDVVTYTGNGAGSRTISHNLGSAPGMIIIKNTSSVTDWAVWHRGDGTTWRSDLSLNTTGASGNSGTTYLQTSTEIQLSQITTAGGSGVNSNGQTFVAYLFAHDAGGFGAAGTDNVISCGTFTTNGSGSATVSLGYEPQWVMIKRTDSTSGWIMFDVMRGMSLTNSFTFQANTSGAEVDNGASVLQPTATGFFVPNAQLPSSSTWIYMAIRRPMKPPTSGTQVFSPIAYTGSGTNSRAFTTDFATDATFWANRDKTIYTQNYFTNKLVGLGRNLETNSTAAEANTGAGRFGSFTNTQVVLGTTASGGFDYSGMPSVIHAFRRASGFFDVVCYTGDGTSTQIPHNLGAIPELCISKRRAATSSWFIDRPLNTTAYNQGAFDTAAFYDNWLPDGMGATSTTIRPPNSSSGQTMVMYLFATLAGVSKVGSYTGTGTTQTINCGFTSGARFVLVKRLDSTGAWYVWDTARGIVSGNDPFLLLNSTAAEDTSTDYIDPVSSGFEISSTAPAAINANGGSFLFLAIA